MVLGLKTACPLTITGVIREVSTFVGAFSGGFVVPESTFLFVQDTLTMTSGFVVSLSFTRTELAGFEHDDRPFLVVGVVQNTSSDN